MPCLLSTYYVSTASHLQNCPDPKTYNGWFKCLRPRHYTPVRFSKWAIDMHIEVLCLFRRVHIAFACQALTRPSLLGQHHSLLQPTAPHGFRNLCFLICHLHTPMGALLVYWQLVRWGTNTSIHQMLDCSQ